MAVMQFMDELKRKLNSDGDKADNLAFVALELTSFYQKIHMSESESLFPKKIYDELYQMPKEPGYTKLTMQLRLETLEKKLLKIIDAIIESTKTKKVPIIKAKKKVLTNNEKNEFKVLFKLGEVEVSTTGKGKKGISQSYKFAVIVLIVGCLAVFIYWINDIVKNQKQPDDRTKIAETLIEDYSGKLDTYKQKAELLNGIIEKQAPGSKERIKAESVLPSITSKIDSLKRVILPDLDLIKNSEIDSGCLLRLNAYQQILKNY